eukprot:15445641-Alexandrium_andersonii.AAC.1
MGAAKSRPSGPAGAFSPMARRKLGGGCGRPARMSLWSEGRFLPWVVAATARHSVLGPTPNFHGLIYFLVRLACLGGLGCGHAAAEDRTCSRSGLEHPLITETAWGNGQLQTSSHMHVPPAPIRARGAARHHVWPRGTEDANDAFPILRPIKIPRNPSGPRA